MGQDGSSWRVSLDFATSSGLSGGHLETEGLTADGRVIGIVEHAHEVTLDLTRYELSVSRTFNDNWDAVLRIPYFIKDQEAEVLFPNGGTPEERAAAIRAGYSHHRTDIYEGFSDFEVGAGWRKRDLFGEDSVFRVSAGVTLPAGATEPDTIVAGEQGLEHLHIQFGNGTFDPVLDFYLGLPLSRQWAFSIFGRGRFPLYENIHGYRGSVEGTLIPRVTFLPSKNLSLSAGISANYYGYAEWSGRRDPNSGQFSLNTSLGAGYKFNKHLTGSFNLQLPLFTDSFSGEDVLEPAPTFSISAGWTF